MLLQTIWCCSIEKHHNIEDTIYPNQYERVADDNDQLDKLGKIVMYITID